MPLKVTTPPIPEQKEAKPEASLNFPLRLTPATRKIAEEIAGAEDISLNEAINQTLLRWHRTPRSWKELGSLLIYLQHEVATVQTIMEESIKNETDLLRELESDRIQLPPPAPVEAPQKAS